MNIRPKLFHDKSMIQAFLFEARKKLRLKRSQLPLSLGATRFGLRSSGRFVARLIPGCRALVINRFLLSASEKDRPGGISGEGAFLR
jgi:hypothetical protein